MYKNKEKKWIFEIKLNEKYLYENIKEQTESLKNIEYN